MEGCFWKILLAVVALSASGHGAPSHKPLTYDKAVELGVANYNRKTEEDSIYRLLEAVPQPEWDPNSEGTQELMFSIKETVCPAGEGLPLEKCNFKQDGIVRECTASYFLGEKPPMAVLNCEAVEGIEKEEEEVEKKDEEENEENQEKEDEEEDQPERSRKPKKASKKSTKKRPKWIFKIIFEIRG